MDAGIHRNVDVITADADRVDLARDTIDAIFARWVFCYLPDSVEVLRHVARFLRPGGTFTAIDYWNYLAIQTEPRSPLFTTIFTAVYESFADAGGSLDVGGRLPAYLSSAGFSVERITPVSAVGRPGSPVWTWIADFQSLYLPMLVERNYLSAATVEAYLDWWRGLEVMPGAFVSAPPMLSVVASRR
jgi:SAM-dependent methyltransferase